MFVQSASPSSCSLHYVPGRSDVINDRQHKSLLCVVGVGRKGQGLAGGRGRGSHRTWPCRDNLSDGICFISSSSAAGSRCRFKVFGNTLFVITGSQRSGYCQGGLTGGGVSACSCRNVVDFICASLLLFVCAAAARRFYLFYFYTHACVCLCV